MQEKLRCPWATQSVLEQEYHDTQWGVPEKDDAILFEMLVLESMQAGLSWHLILTKRENFRKAFDGFNPDIIAHYPQEKLTKLMEDQGIVRNRLKIHATVSNAKAFIEIQKEFGSFGSYIWEFVGHKPLINHYQKIEEAPSKTDLSEKISKELKKRGFKFLGPTTVYSFMQAVGMVDDHLDDCFRKQF